MKTVIRYCSLCGNVILGIPEGIIVPLVFCNRKCADDYGANKPAHCERPKGKS